MESITKYLITPIGSLYIFKTLCSFAYKIIKPKEKIINQREFKKLNNVKTKNITEDYGGNSEENKKYIFVINIDELHKEEGSSFLSIGNIKHDNSNFEHISNIIDFVILNVKPEEEIILNIDSPGGSVIEYFYVYNQLKRLKDKGYTLNIFIKKMAASGGYLLACLGNITATNDSQIGSIGVYSGSFNYHELIKFLKIGYKLYKSGDYKNLGDPFEVPTKEGDKKLQDDVTNIHKRFKKVIFENRKDLDMDKISNADVWFGDEAKDLGLVDNIGTINDYLIEKAKDYTIYEINYHQENKSASVNWLNLILGHYFSYYRL